MTKADLKTGMRVKTRNGITYVVVLNYKTGLYGFQDVFFVGDNGFMTGDSYGDDLLCITSGEYSFDIAKVYAQPKDHFFLNIKETGRIIWERKEPKSMTLAEIEQELGYPVKIIK